MQISAERANPKKFILHVTDKIFKDKNELLKIDSHDIDTDHRIPLIQSKYMRMFFT